MRRVFRRFLLFLLVALFIPFALTNRHAVAVGYWPLPGALELPLFLLILATLALGILLGSLVRIGDRLRGLLRREGRPS